jgi:hypothetical protein
MSAAIDQAPRARILNVSLDEYRADPCAVPSLNQSIAHTLVTRSPAHAWCEHPKLGNLPAEPTKAKDDGAVIHALLLGKGADVDVLECDNFRTKAARAIRDEAIEAGRVPMLRRRYDQIIEASARIRSNLDGYGVSLDGEHELPIEWHEAGDEGYVVCRAALDTVRLDAGVIVDVKKIVSADPRTCERHAYEYGYDIQCAAYTSALEKLKPKHAGRVDFIFVFMELEPPYAVVPCRPSGTFRELGRRRWGRAVLTWERCLRDGYWPSYTESITQLDAPQWALTQEETYG